jgi:N-acetylmuramoyl-L-alanine amidase-like
MKTSAIKEIVLTGKWTREELDSIIRESVKITNASGRIDFLSGHLLGLAYREHTLIGDTKRPEVFVINLEGVDCFTLIDYIEAMRLSGSFSEFKARLRKVRYRSGRVSFKNRKHFFTDWVKSDSGSVYDATQKTGGNKTLRVQEILNERGHGTYFLDGIQPVKRWIKYIPSERVDDPVLQKLRTGDYVGIYSELKGLDVSHVGIFIRKKDRLYLRHASSRKAYRKVVDQDFRKYISTKPGIIVLRPKAQVI